MKTSAEKTLRIFTIGHSNLSFEDFASLLKEFGICLVADIRRYPSSRKFPHFNRQVLSKLLAVENIEYQWLEALGGRRHAEKNDKSLNIGLKSPGLRNYADHMGTDEFRTAVQELLSTAAISRTAVMCAEKLYWKCHRKLLADYLVAQGIEVVHIVGSDKLSIHKLTSYAIATETGVIYPLLETDDIQKSFFDLDAQTEQG
ncbi:MAG TPA: DUF488 domain-containing protein [Sedimentisphaerales bacterium]|nr:DUF488 domain-containing protein [Sedimentisphaerales bacterium]